MSGTEAAGEVLREREVGIALNRKDRPPEQRAGMRRAGPQGKKLAYQSRVSTSQWRSQAEGRDCIAVLRVPWVRVLPTHDQGLPRPAAAFAPSPGRYQISVSWRNWVDVGSSLLRLDPVKKVRRSREPSC